jgi:hypothetical protein
MHVRSGQTAPSVPFAPGAPTEPAGPGKPALPGAPAGPSGPGTPGTQWAQSLCNDTRQPHTFRSTPSVPFAPGLPDLPGGPRRPFGPTSPSVPLAPCTHVTMMYPSRLCHDQPAHSRPRVKLDGTLMVPTCGPGGPGNADKPEGWDSAKIFLSSAASPAGFFSPACDTTPTHRSEPTTCMRCREHAMRERERAGVS